MTSFAVAIEPAPQQRLAALLLLTHLFAAASPWIARCPPMLATAMSVLAMAGLLASLARVPGPHCLLRSLTLDADGCRIRLAGQDTVLKASIGPGTRVYAALIVLDLVAGGRRHGWLLPRRTLPTTDFRRLKALIRLT